MSCEQTGEERNPRSANGDGELGSTMAAPGLASAAYGPSLLDLAEIYASSPDALASVNAARALGMLVGCVFGGMLYRKINDQIVMIVMLSLTGLTSTVVPLLSDAGGVATLYAVGLIGGCTLGVFEIGSQVRLVRIWHKQSASALQAFHTAYGIGAMIAPFVLAPFLSDPNDAQRDKAESRLWRAYAVFGATFGVVVVSSCAYWAVDREPLDNDDKHGAKPAVGSPTSTHDHGEADKAWRRFERLVTVLLAVYILICVNTEVIFSGLLSVYAVKNELLLFSREQAAYLTGLFWTAFTGGRVVSIFFAVFLNLDWLLIASHLLLIVASAILIIWNDIAWCTWLGSGLLGLGLSSLYGAGSGHVFRFLRVRHFHVSVILVAGCLGSAVSAFVVPPVVDAHPMFLQWFTGASNVLHALTLAAMLWATRGRPTNAAGSEETASCSNVVCKPGGNEENLPPAIHKSAKAR